MNDPVSLESAAPDPSAMIDETHAVPLCQSSSPGDVPGMSSHPVAFPVRRKKADLSQVQVALVSMPWRLPRLPAIGLASLKAAALQAGVGRCDVLYLNDRWFRFLLKHGDLSEELRRMHYTVYNRTLNDLSRVMLAGEWMFSAAVFGGDVCPPDRFAEIFEKEAQGHPHARFSD